MFNRRLAIFFLLFLIMVVVIFVRLVQLQVFNYQEYLERAQEVMLRPPVLLPPVRGRIFDRHGQLLAGNIPCFDLAIHYGAIRFDEKYLKRLATNRARRQLKLTRRLTDEEIAPYVLQVRGEIEAMWRELPALVWQSEEFRSKDDLLGRRRREIIKKVELMRQWYKTSLQKRQEELQDNWLSSVEVQEIGLQINSFALREERSFIPIVYNLENDIARQIQAHFGFPEWFTLIPTTRRVYPYGCVAAQTIGSVGPVLGDDPLYLKHRLGNPEDSHGDDPYRGYAAEEDVIGRSGLERGYEWDVLRGRRGLLQNDRLGNIVSDSSLDPQKGRDLYLTIDIDLQADIERIMPRDSPAAAVVIDVLTGQVLALVSTPLLARPDAKPPFSIRGANPWMNRAVEAGYQPGSTVKPLIILAGLSEKDRRTGLPLITERTIFHCPSSEFSRPSCVYSHGSVGPFDAVKHSCNVYSATVAQKLGSSLLVWFNDFGLTHRASLSLPREYNSALSGLVSDRFGVLPSLQAWEARQFAIGQGRLTVTPLQVANMMATLARRGVYIPPSLNIKRNQIDEPTHLDFDPRAMDLVLRALEAVVNESGGTAYGVSELRSLGIRVAGKTGTAEYKPDLNDWRCWFSGFAPADNPQIAFSVVIEHGSFGAQAAAPVAADLLRECIKHGYIKSSSSAGMSLPSVSPPG